MGLAIGVVGKPNVGKSTFFNAATAGHAEVANYPFTTIHANRGVAYVRTKCPHVDFGKPACSPKHGSCVNGTRFVPVETIDVAGLVPDAHKGKGMGNKFLGDLVQAQALIHIVDASGATDAEGNPVNAGTHDPLADVAFLEKELDWWIAGLISEGWERLGRRVEQGEALEKIVSTKLAGLGISELHIKKALAHATMDPPEFRSFAAAIRRESKPLIVAANKVDKAPPPNIERLKSLEQGGTIVTFCSAESELALRKAAEHKLITYQPGATGFEPAPGATLSAGQKTALDYIRANVLAKFTSTGIQTALETAAYKLLKLIVVYPVEDETHLTDKAGNVLPDAFLIPEGTTAKEMAFLVHTDLGKHFIRAIDARTKRVIGHDHAVKNGDVIKIVADV